MTPSNPIVDHIDQKMSELHPLAKAALDRAMAASPGGVPMMQAQPQQLEASPQPQPRPLATAGSMKSPLPPSMPAADSGMNLMATPANEMAAPAMPPEQRKLTDLRNSPSGIGGIKSPWARIPLQIADAVGGGLFPGIEQRLPGTQGHHDVLVRQQERAQAGETAEQDAATKRGLETAQTAHADAQTHEILNPTPEEPKTPFLAWRSQHPQEPVENWLKTEEGMKYHPPQKPDEYADYRDAYLKANPNATGVDVVKQYSKDHAGPPTSEGELPLGERVGQVNQMLASRYQVLHKGQQIPAHYQLPPNATQKDAERISSALRDEESASATQAQREQAQQNHRETMATLAASRENKADTGMKTAVLKEYAPAMDSAERFNVMTRNYEEAVKNHDQQAMLSLLANHLGMTMGLQKGARITKDIIREAEKSRPWLQGITSKFDSDGYLSGVTLTPVQMRQMVDLGRDRFKEDVVKSGSRSKYLGATDAGPERIPSDATLNFYMGQANGDVNKAKQLAAADGWSTK